VKVSCLARAYNSYGSSILTTAAEHLELALVNIDPTDLAIEITAYLHHVGPARSTLEGLLEQHILSFPPEVRVRHRAKAGKLHIDYPSALQESESFGPGGIYAVAHVLPRALDEVSAAVLDGLRSKPAIWKMIDASALDAAIEEARASLPKEPANLLDYMRRMDVMRRASASNPTSIDDLDIEWEQYHPSAKAVLAAPLFWPEIDDDAPHGNDTGSDLLAAFRRWQKRNPTASYEGYVDRLLSRWGLTAKKARGRLDATQLDWIRQEADVALAFAAIKVRGKCEERETSLAIAAIDQRLKRLDISIERKQKLLLLRQTLQGQLHQHV
jgi:uncharacterized protein YfeS